MMNNKIIGSNEPMMRHRACYSEFLSLFVFSTLLIFEVYYAWIPACKEPRQIMETLDYDSQIDQNAFSVTPEPRKGIIQK